MQFQEPQLSGSDGGAYEFIHITLILRVKKQLSNLILFIHMFLELFLVLDNMLKNKFLFGCILFIG